MLKQLICKVQYYNLTIYDAAMKKHRYHFLILLSCVFLLLSCDLLGIGDDDNEDEIKERDAQPELIWKQEIIPTNTNSYPLIEDSSAYIDLQFALRKISLKTGKGIWAFPYDVIGAKIMGNMLSDENTLYVHFKNFLKAFNKSDGTVKWKIDFGTDFDRLELAPGNSLLAQTEMQLFIGTRQKLLIVNKQQGSVEQTIIPQVSDGYQTLNVPVVSASDDQLVFLLTAFNSKNSVTTRGRLAAYNSSDGSVTWETFLPYTLSDISAFFVPKVQMVAAQGILAVLTGPAVVAFDATTGEQLWSYLFYENRTDIDIGSLLTYHHNSIYVAADPRILKFDLADGHKIWEISASGPLYFTQRLFVDNGNLYFSAGSSPGLSVTLYSTDTKTGELNYQIPSPKSGLLAGFTTAFDVEGRYLVEVGRQQLYGYKLPEQ